MKKNHSKVCEKLLIVSLSKHQQSVHIFHIQISVHYLLMSFCFLIYEKTMEFTCEITLLLNINN